jgi:hypothetical protein
MDLIFDINIIIHKNFQYDIVYSIDNNDELVVASKIYHILIRYISVLLP